MLVAEHPTDAACDVLQTKDMKIFPIHAGNAVRQNHHLIVEVEGSERCLEYAGVGVDAIKQTVRTPRLWSRMSRSVPI